MKYPTLLYIHTYQNEKDIWYSANKIEGQDNSYYFYQCDLEKSKSTFPAELKSQTRNQFLGELSGRDEQTAFIKKQGLCLCSKPTYIQLKKSPFEKLELSQGMQADWDNTIIDPPTPRCC